MIISNEEYKEYQELLKIKCDLLANKEEYEQLKDDNIRVIIKKYNNEFIVNIDSTKLSDGITRRVKNIINHDLNSEIDRIKNNVINHLSCAVNESMQYKIITLYNFETGKESGYHIDFGPSYSRYDGITEMFLCEIKRIIQGVHDKKQELEQEIKELRKEKRKLKPWWSIYIHSKRINH